MLPVTHQNPSTIPPTDNDEVLDEAGPLLEEAHISPDRYANAFEAHPSFFQSIAHTVCEMKRLVTGRRKFQILLCSFFLTALASSDTKLLVQYISKRYEWTFAEVRLFTLATYIKPLTFHLGGLHALSKGTRKLHFTRYYHPAHHPYINVVQNSAWLRDSPQHPRS
jgi:hypothetical protein